MAGDQPIESCAADRSTNHVSTSFTQWYVVCTNVDDAWSVLERVLLTCLEVERVLFLFPPFHFPPRSLHPRCSCMLGHLLHVSEIQDWRAEGRIHGRSWEIRIAEGVCLLRSGGSLTCFSLSCYAVRLVHVQLAFAGQTAFGVVYWMTVRWSERVFQWSGRP